MQRNPANKLSSYMMQTVLFDPCLIMEVVYLLTLWMTLKLIILHLSGGVLVKEKTKVTSPTTKPH